MTLSCCLDYCRNFLTGLPVFFLGLYSPFLIRHLQWCILHLINSMPLCHSVPSSSFLCLRLKLNVAWSYDTSLLLSPILNSYWFVHSLVFQLPCCSLNFSKHTPASGPVHLVLCLQPLSLGIWMTYFISSLNIATLVKSSISILSAYLTFP